VDLSRKIVFSSVGNCSFQDLLRRQCSQPCTCYLKQAEIVQVYLYSYSSFTNIAMEVDYPPSEVSVLINSSEDVSDDSSAEDENSSFNLDNNLISNKASSNSPLPVSRK
jgi:hypothetical protein